VTCNSSTSNAFYLK